MCTYDRSVTGRWMDGTAAGAPTPELVSGGVRVGMPYSIMNDGKPCIPHPVSSWLDRMECVWVAGPVHECPRSRLSFNAE